MRPNLIFPILTLNSASAIARWYFDHTHARAKLICFNKIISVTVAFLLSIFKKITFSRQKFSFTFVAMLCTRYIQSLSELHKKTAKQKILLRMFSILSLIKAIGFLGPSHPHLLPQSLYYLGWNRSPAQVRCMRQALGPGALGRPRGSRWRGRWEGGSGLGTHVNPLLFHFNVWQNSLQKKKSYWFNK